RASSSPTPRPSSPEPSSRPSTPASISAWPAPGSSTRSGMMSPPPRPEALPDALSGAAFISLSRVRFLESAAVAAGPPHEERGSPNQMEITTIGTPIMWIGFTVFVLAMLAIDLGVFHRKAHEISLKEAGIWSAVWVSLAALFGAGVYHMFGAERAGEFATGY